MLAGLAVRRGVLLALAVFVLYAWLAPSHILGGDNAEFATLGRTGGVAHPSGYPLYVMWLRATSWLPGSPAHAAALATAFLGAASALVLFQACRAWGAGVAASGLAVAIVAGSPIVLRLGSEAEVFALNGLVAATILWLAADAGPARGVRRVGLLGLIAGLGLAHHLSIVTLAPLGVLGAIRGIREASGRRAVAVLAGLGGVVVGLTPYLYLLAAPSDGVSWGRLDGAGDLVHHVLRLDYGAFQLGVTEHEVTASEGIGALLAAVGRGWLWLPLVAALIAFGLGLGRRREAGPSRVTWAALLVTWIAAGPLLIGRFNLAPTGLSAHVVERFYYLPIVLLAVPVAIGLEHALAELARRRGGRQLSDALATALVIAVLAGSASTSLDRVKRDHSPAVQRYLENTLSVLPPDAVVIGSGDHHLFGFSYLQLAVGVRQDVVYIDWALTGYPWYRTRLDARVGAPAIPDGPGPASVRLTRALLTRGHPVFLAGPHANILEAFPSYPIGTVIRVLPPGAPLPTLDAIVADNEAALAGFDLRYPRPGLDDGWAVIVHLRYAETWTSLAGALERAGRADDAARARRIAAQLVPMP